MFLYRFHIRIWLLLSGPFCLRRPWRRSLLHGDLRTSSPLPLSALAPAERARLLAPPLAALSDERRLTILLTLAEGAMTNRELHEASGMSPALVSHHLVALRSAGLVESAPVGRSTLNS